MAARHDFVILAVDAASAEAQLLLDALSDALLRINGDSGRSSFDVEAATPRGGFYLARDAAGELLGCAALRPLGEARTRHRRTQAHVCAPGATGTGAALLAHVEAQARLAWLPGPAPVHPRGEYPRPGVLCQARLCTRHCLGQIRGRRAIGLSGQEVIRLGVADLPDL